MKARSKAKARKAPSKDLRPRKVSAIKGGTVPIESILNTIYSQVESDATKDLKGVRQVTKGPVRH